MRRRRQKDESGSLDLLLDTICNTFGGILLISLLVVILLNSSSTEIADKSPSKASQVELLETAIRQQELLEDIRRLREAVGNAKENQSDVLPMDVFRVAREIERLKFQNSEGSDEKAELLDELANTQSEVNAISERQKETREKLAAAKKKLDAITQRIEEEVNRRSRTAVIPQVQRSTKSARTFFLVRGKLLGPVRTSNGDFDLKVVSVSSNGSEKQLKPRSSGGIKVLPGGSKNPAIKNKFAGISSKLFDIQLFVWPDSFVHCRAVRDVLEQLNLKCDLRPMTKSGTIVVGSSGGNQTAQ